MTFTKFHCRLLFQIVVRRLFLTWHSAELSIKREKKGTSSVGSRRQSFRWKPTANASRWLTRKTEGLMQRDYDLRLRLFQAHSPIAFRAFPPFRFSRFRRLNRVQVREEETRLWRKRRGFASTTWCIRVAGKFVAKCKKNSKVTYVREISILLRRCSFTAFYRVFVFSSPANSLR